MENLSLNVIPVQLIGEQISHSLGAEFVSSFQRKFPDEISAYEIGRNILEAILCQPHCEGIKFFNAINEYGSKTLVYVGIDENAKEIINYSTIEPGGKLTEKAGIVADRVKIPTGIPRPNSVSADELDWNWICD